jgi:hypothetical protein
MADELIIDESFTRHQTVGDFDVSAVLSPMRPRVDSMFNDDGEITTGELFKIFQQRGMKSVSELTICLDIDPTVGGQTNYALHAMELLIQGKSDEDWRSFQFGDNSLMVPGYEASALKPEAQLSVKLDYDFMQRFNENSTEKLKFNYFLNGEEKAVPVKAWVQAKENQFSLGRFLLVSAFALFWIFVFAALLRMTNPTPQKKSKVVSPA